MVANLLPLNISEAVIRRQGHRLIGPISLELGETGLTVIIGPNGAGKTTFLRMIHGLDRLTAGQLTWACPPEQARTSQAFVFQTPIVLRRNTLDNVAYPLLLRGVPNKVARQRARARLEAIGLAGHENQRAGRLSGGEKQKLALARALITEPKMLLLDEPCASLDGRSTREIEEILAGARSAGTRIVMSTHDLGQARRLADEILFIAGGRLREFCPAAQFFEGPKTSEGQAFLRGDIVE